MSRAADAVRLAFGTLTVLPVRPPAVDRGVAGVAMALAPAAGLALALPVAGLVVVTDADLSPLLVAALAVGLLALLTRGLHLDGLADTADGLGSGKRPEQALDVMRRGDVGPFGVVTVVLVMLVQAGALSQLVAVGLGPLGLGLALVLSRLVLPLACFRAVPAARSDGLGAVVARSVTPPLLLLAVVVGLVCAGLLVLAALSSDLFVIGSPVPATGWVLRAAVVAPLGLLPALLLARRCLRRFGGITGDVLGALVETTFTATLVVLCL